MAGRSEATASKISASSVTVFNVELVFDIEWMFDFELMLDVDEFPWWLVMNKGRG